MDNESLENEVTNLLPEVTDRPTQENILHIVLRHRWLILGTTSALLLGALIYLVKATPIYTSESRIYVEQTGPRLISEYEGVMTRSSNYLNTQGELMKSTPIIFDVVENPHIRHLRTFADVDNLVAYIKKNLKVAIGRRDDIITVSFDSAYPVEAAQLVNTVVDSYISCHSTRKRSTVLEVLKILQKEKIKRDQELAEKFDEMVQFTRDNGVFSLDSKAGNIIFERLATLSAAVTDAELATLNARADFEAAQSIADDPAKIKQFAAAALGPTIHVPTDDQENRLRSELRATEIELNDVMYQCTEEHPSVRAINTKIDYTRQQLADQEQQYAQTYVEVMRLRWFAAKQRQDELATSFDTQVATAREQGVKGAQYAVLQSELKRTERICEILDDRIKELNITEDAGALNISILEVARAATSPSRPQKARTMAMALALGLILGCGLAFIRDWMDYRLRSSEEVSAILAIPVLGVVPSMSQGQRIIVSHGHKMLRILKSALKKITRPKHAETPAATHEVKVGSRRQRILSRAAVYRGSRADRVSRVQEPRERPSVARTRAGGDQAQTLEKLTIVARGQAVRLKPRSMVAEAYRTIRTAVFFGAPKGEVKTILITSPEQGDGKTTLVSNLAIAMAQAGQRTLILDGDFRRPKQHQIFEMENEIGLANVLAAAANVDEAIQRGPVPGLDILSCGPEVPNPSELLNSDAFAEILNSLRNCYDRIIIDSPPVIPVADSQILAATCDVTLLVLRADKSTRRYSRYARDTLLSVGARVLGAVINDVPHKHGRYGYYSRYGHYGGYGHHYGYYGDRKEKTG